MTPSQRERLRFAYQQARFMRPDAARYLRPDAARYMRPQPAERKFRADQPRVPAGDPDGGQWTDDFPTDISAQSRHDPDGKPRILKITVRPRPGMGHNNGPALEDPPEIPPERPPTPQARTSFMRAAALWLGRAVLIGLVAEVYFAKLAATAWLKTFVPAITSYYDPPKTLRELQDAVSSPERGYDIHHIVEQGPALLEGYTRGQIDAPDNLARIPRIKHWEITGWYNTKNLEYGGLTPRQYLRNMPWEEKRRVGLKALREFGVLAP
jgi:hypothetical protein